MEHFIAGRKVCKDFFRLATGFDQRLFNAVYSEVSLDQLPDEGIGKLVRGIRVIEEDVIAFLDSYMASECALVETDPAGKVTHFLGKRWSECYTYDYLPSCASLEIKAAPYNLFCAIRKRERPRFQRNPKIQKTGWHHVSCFLCESFKADIRTERDLVRRANLKATYRVHHGVAKGHRQHYKRARHKAVHPSRESIDMSVIIDAAGGLGASFSPHFTIRCRDPLPLLRPRGM